MRSLLCVHELCPCGYYESYQRHGGFLAGIRRLRQRDARVTIIVMFPDSVNGGAIPHQELRQRRPALFAVIHRPRRPAQRGARVTIPIFPDCVDFGALLHEELRQRQPALAAVMYRYRRLPQRGARATIIIIFPDDVYVASP